jgi:hypothetical protein
MARTVNSEHDGFDIGEGQALNQQVDPGECLEKILDRKK